MTALDTVRAAHRRIGGWLVAAPVVGGPCLPGRVVPGGLRVKLDLLQPSGSTWFRGSMHALARELGRAKGVVVHGDHALVLAWATAAAAQRVPAIAVVPADDAEDESRAERLAAIDGAWVEVERVADPEAAATRAGELCATRGYLAAAGPGAAAFDDGVATLGLELADELPSDVERVLVTPAPLARAVVAGVAASGRELAVESIAAAPERRAERRELAKAVRLGLRVCCEPRGLAALDVALDAHDAEPVCVVLAE